MLGEMRFLTVVKVIVLLVFGAGVVGCATNELDSASNSDVQVPKYKIGPGDTLVVFVWGNADLSASVTVRPDGFVTTPLAEDVQASGKTASQLAREMEKKLARFVKSPKVTITVTGFVGRYSEQIRVIGEAAKPRALPYRESMTLLDVLIAVGGLTEFASGNSATLIRAEGNERKEYSVRLDDLAKGGDMTANVNMLPGDILIIPESWF